MSGCFDLCFEWEARAFTLDFTQKCCVCLREEFDFLSEVELTTPEVACVSCGHQESKQVKKKLPCCFVVCAHCFHSCTICSIFPIVGLVLRSTCGACQSTVVERFNGAVFNNKPTSKFSEEAVLIRRDSQARCSSCGYSSTTQPPKKVEVDAKLPAHVQEILRDWDEEKDVDEMCS